MGRLRGEWALAVAFWGTVAVLAWAVWGVVVNW